MAKLHRGRIFLEYDRLYLEYGFAKHKGYPTKEHLENIEKYSILEFIEKAISQYSHYFEMSKSEDY